MPSGELIFDDAQRDDARPSRYNEPTFTFLNRSAGEAWQRVRDLVEDWFRHVPAAARPDLRSRLRSTTGNDFRSAFFELYCIETLLRSDWTIELHPTLGHTSRRPDLRAQRGNESFFLEATTTATPRHEASAESRVNAVIDDINDRLEIGSFMLGIDVISIGANAPSTRRLCDELRSWLDGLDPDALREAARGGGDETHEWAFDAWSLVFKAFPLAADKRGPGGRIVGTIMPAEASFVDDITPLRRRVTDKAKAYGDLDTGFVVAVGAISSFSGDGDIASALYGSSAVQYYVNPAPGAPPPAAIRLNDGLIAGPNGWRRTEVSALVTTTMLTPWTIATTVPTWWTNSGADHALSLPRTTPARSPPRSRNTDDRLRRRRVAAA